ncbi:ATP-binding protein [Vallicoccus soli]|uniref:ATP-binding protein n=1 Tax=Vallicoccus soli TaxID=2339232 RepID=A0A3A3YPW2_9ACTN|nr:ATP-binding protein [Vallicoccus soli]RJK93394.1 ATP-binding protein [Vallicoccus soli]
MGSDPHALLALVAGAAERLAATGRDAAVTADVLPSLVRALAARGAVLALGSADGDLRVVATEPPGAPPPLDGTLVRAARDGVAQWPGGTGPGRAAVPLLREGEVVGALGLSWDGPHPADGPERHALGALAALVAAVAPAPSPLGRGLRHHAHPAPAGVGVACAARPGGARCAVSAPGAHGDAFATLLDSPLGLGSAPLDAVRGVLALARRRSTPPALVGKAVAELAPDLDAEVFGAHVEACPDSAWLAVAPLDHAVVVATTPGGEGDPRPPAADRLAGERLLLARAEPVAVAAAAIDPGADAGTAQAVHDVLAGCLARPLRPAEAQPEPPAGAPAPAAGAPDPAADLALDLAHDLERALAAAGLDAPVRGLLVVVASGRPDLRRRGRTLPSSPVAARLGRQFVAAALPADAPPGVRDEVSLAAAELLSNAVRHAHEQVEVVVEDEPDGLLLSVTDDDERVPEPAARAGDGWAETGRGLAVLAALVDEHGTTPRPGGGKEVWARVRWRRRTAGAARA